MHPITQSCPLTIYLNDNSQIAYSVTIDKINSFYNQNILKYTLIGLGNDKINLISFFQNLKDQIQPKSRIELFLQILSGFEEQANSAIEEIEDQLEGKISLTIESDKKRKANHDPSPKKRVAFEDKDKIFTFEKNQAELDAIFGKMLSTEEKLEQADGKYQDDLGCYTLETFRNLRVLEITFHKPLLKFNNKLKSIISNLNNSNINTLILINQKFMTIKFISTLTENVSLPSLRFTKCDMNASLIAELAKGNQHINNLEIDGEIKGGDWILSIPTLVQNYPALNYLFMNSMIKVENLNFLDSIIQNGTKLRNFKMGIQFSPSALSDWVSAKREKPTLNNDIKLEISFCLLYDDLGEPDYLNKLKESRDSFNAKSKEIFGRGVKLTLNISKEIKNMGTKILTLDELITYEGLCKLTK